jgi:hypothetical protein
MIMAKRIDREPVIRYVPTVRGRRGDRVLVLAAQGRNTWPTPEEAQRWLDTLLQVNTPERLRSIYGPLAPGSFEVRAVPCWPGHHDPQRTIFDD